MAGFLPTGSEEREVIDAYTMIFETAKFVQEQLNKSENTAVLMEIQRRIHHDKPLDIVHDDRKLIIESQFLLVGHKKSTMIFILFNDSILIAKPQKNSPSRVKEMLSLAAVQFEKATETSFILKTTSNVYKVSGRAEECSQWVSYLSAFEERNKLNRTIGVPLDVILKREAAKIPSIIIQCIERIRSFPDGTKTEGLFRISGEHNQIIALRDIFDKVPIESRDLKPFSIHAIAGVLKMFLRELPEPLLPFSVYDKLVQIERNVGEGDINAEQLSVYKAAVASVGASNLPTLKYLMDFLIKEVSIHFDVNKMTPSNLAIVFGPTLMRPKIETMETTLNSPLVNHSVQRIIENFYKLMPE